ncbi:hypothetical protein P4530_13305 [Bacillus thuringiensis]|nr:hypothetical protein [Bacillus thuringiensis]
MREFLDFIKSKQVIIAFIMAIAYQVIMVGSYIPGYSAFPKNLNKLSVAIINEDTHYGKLIKEQLQEALPFQKVEGLTLSEAKKELNERKLHMIIHLPNNLTEKVSTPKQKVNIDFYINEANPTMVSSTLKQVARQTETKINQIFTIQGTKEFLQKLDIPEEQANQIATNISTKLKTNLITSNTVPLGMNNQMAPMFLTMATYTAALFAASQLVSAFRRKSKLTGKWTGFYHIQVTGLIMAIISPIIGISIFYFTRGYGISTFFYLWMHHAIQLFVSLQFNLIIVLLVGQIGTIINMGLMMMLVIANGSMMTREMMLLPYKILSYISPMYYSVNTDFSLLFGGGNILQSFLFLLTIGLVSFLINCLIIKFKIANPNNKLKVE